MILPNVPRDAQKDDADGAAAAVHRDLPQIQVECLPDVHLRIDGKEVKPGDTAWTDGAAAIHLVSLGHARIVGSR